MVIKQVLRDIDEIIDDSNGFTPISDVMTIMKVNPISKIMKNVNSMVESNVMGIVGKIDSKVDGLVSKIPISSLNKAGVPELPPLPDLPDLPEPQGLMSKLKGLGKR